MAAVIKLHAARRLQIPLKPFIEYHHYLTTCVTTQFETPTGTGTATKTVTCKQDLQFAPDASYNERLIWALDDFKEECLEPKRFHSQDKTMHKKTFDIIGGNLRVIWKAILQAAVHKTSAHLVSNTCAFLAKFLPSNAFLIQQEYLISATEPFSMTCFVTASRLLLINTLSIYLPGSNNKELFTGPSRRTTGPTRPKEEWRGLFNCFIRPCSLNQEERGLCFSGLKNHSIDHGAIHGFVSRSNKPRHKPQIFFWSISCTIRPQK